MVIEENAQKLDSGNLEKKVEYLAEELKEVQKRQDKLAKKLGENQPKNKLKIVKTETDSGGNLIKRIASEPLQELKSELEESGNAMTSSEIQTFLDKRGFDRSKPSILRIMRRLNAEFDSLKFIPRKKGADNSCRLTYVDKYIT